jgi:hypothetical protein
VPNSRWLGVGLLAPRGCSAKASSPLLLLWWLLLWLQAVPQ